LIALAFARFRASAVVLQGVSVAGILLGGASASEAEGRLRQRAREIEKGRLSVRVAGKAAELAASDAGLAIDVKASVKRALGAGRGPAWLGELWRYLTAPLRTVELELAGRLESARLSAALSALESRHIPDLPFGGAIEFEAGRATARPPRAGRRIAASAEQAIARALLSGRLQPALELPLERVVLALAPGALERAQREAEALMAAKLSLQSGERQLVFEPRELAPLLVSERQGNELAIRLDAARLDAWLAPRRAALEAPAQNARFEISARDEVQVVPSASGVTLDTGAFSRALHTAAASSNRTSPLPLLAKPEPSLSTEAAHGLGIVALVGSFTTRFPCCQTRVKNIERIARILDSYLVFPGQTVSLNEVVGPRTVKNGFVLAPGIEDGEMVDTPGGGVSQFATTLFNALFHAGYDIVERQPHTYWFPRYPMGHEATLSWPKPDLIFRNDTAAGLLIKTSVSKTSVTVKLYGNSEGRKVRAQVSERREIEKPPIELWPNRDVPPDEEKVKDGGVIGWSVIASREVTFADGTSKQERRKVTYKPQPRRLEVHPCRIPEGDPGATGEPCPEPEDAEQPSESGANSAGGTQTSH
jgi:vancomycin resistance protein YoaR